MDVGGGGGGKTKRKKRGGGGKKQKADDEKVVWSGETGSYRFMAPENFMHEQVAEHAAAGDIFSFAMIAFWLLEGTPPMMHMQGEDAIREISLKKMRPTFRDPSLPIHKLVVPIVKACWRHEPARRPSAAELVRMLEEVVEDPVAARPERERAAAAAAFERWTAGDAGAPGCLACCSVQ